jgi:hypothetical protein
MELSLSVPAPEPAPLSAASVALAASSNATVEALADSVARTASEVARALEHVSNMCAMLGERLDADREERRALTEAIVRLGGTVPTTADAPATVLGGTVYSSPEPEPEPERESVITLLPAPEPAISLLEDDDEPAPAEPANESLFASPPAARERDESMVEDDGVVPSVSLFASPPAPREPEVSLVDEDPAPAEPISESFFASPPPAREEEVISIVEEEVIAIVEDEEELVLPASEPPTGAGMWCRDDDQWIGGVEIADFISDNGTIRYWLRRTSDGRMLPHPFDATDLRFIRETSSAGGD